MSVSVNGVARTLAFLNRYDSTLLAYVAWDGQGGGGAAGSTQVAVSSVAGNVLTSPQSTLWGGNAGFHFDGSGNLLTAGGAGGSSQVTISQALDSSGGGVVFADSANSALRVNVVAGAAGGSTAVTISRVQDSSNTGLAVGDSVNNAVRVNVVAGAAGGSTIVTVSTGSVRVHQSTAADLQATVAQASTTWAVQLTQWSTTHNVSSLAGKVTVDQLSTAWQVQINGNSTVVQGTNPWTIAGNCTVAPLAGSTWATRPIQSSAADLQVTATLGTNLQSTAAPSSNSSGLIVRQVVDNILTTSSTSAFATTSLTIQSSGAALKSYVVAYSITTTNAGPSKVCFYSSGVMLWPVQLAAVSSAVTGVNLAVSAPAYLFRTIGAADALTLNLGGGASTVGGWRVGVSYFRAP